MISKIVVAVARFDIDGVQMHTVGDVALVDLVQTDRWQVGATDAVYRSRALDVFVRRHGRMLRRVHAVAIALLLLVGSACRVDRGDRSGLPDSAASAADTLIAIAPGAVEYVDSTPAAPSPADTTPLVATTEELDELAARLTIPVEGVAPADLVDTYDELRGGGSRTHESLDIPAPMGTPVRSASDGRLLRLHASDAGGLMVYAADASGRFILMYGHLDRYAEGLVEGQALARGQVIGYVGATGNAPSGTPHLHFAIARGWPSVAWWTGTPVNPFPLLTRASSLDRSR